MTYYEHWQRSIPQVPIGALKLMAEVLREYPDEGATMLRCLVEAELIRRGKRQLELL